MEVAPAELPIPPRRPLKRSASTASLPTPPRTRRRRDKSRGRSNGISSSDNSENEDAGTSEHALLSSSDDEEDGGYELPQIGRKANKKRRLSLGKGDDGNEEAFWLSPADKEPGARTIQQANVSDQGEDTDVDLDAEDLHPSVPLVYRKLSRSRSQSSTSTGLASPPPSHRKPQFQTQAPITPPAGDTPGPSTVGRLKLKSSIDSPPVTPKKQTGYVTRARTKALRTPEFPIISDSPDNPFYVAPATPSPGTESEGPRVSSVPHTPKMDDSWVEKPTVTYVFRGVRKEYHNPLYNHAKNKPLTPPPNSKLPIDHPDYSPDMACKPTLLFPAARTAAKRSQRVRPTANAKGDETTAQGSLRRSPRRRRPVIGDSDDELQKSDFGAGSDGGGRKEAGAFIRPRKLDFGVAKNKASAIETKKPSSMRSGTTTVAVGGKGKEQSRTITRKPPTKPLTKTATKDRRKNL